MKYCATCHVTYPSEVDSCPVDNSALSTTTEPVQGMIIRGKYEIVEKIASGGMATVYRARHLAFDEVRAIKVVRGWLANDQEFVRRLRAEAVIARKLKHPNAVRIDDLDQLEDGRPFIVMEYVEGTNLRKVIHDGGALPLARALYIARQVVSALAAAHALGIIHRDIKPDNIVLQRRPDGGEQVKVLDFGIAKVRGGTAVDGSQTRTGLVLCTPEYASPEQARGSNSEELDGRSDLYSVGVVLYEMLTGALPFRSDTPFGTLLAQVNSRPRLPSDLRPDLNFPEAANALLMKALEKDPAKRFQTAQEMLEAIAAIDGGTAMVERRTNIVSMPVRTVPAPEPEPAGGEYLLAELNDGRKSRAWMYTTIAVLLVAAAFGAWWFTSYQSRARVSREAERQVQELSHRVDRLLAGSPAAAQIHADVRDGVVVLSGASTGDSVNELAEKLAELDGVFRVEKGKVQVVRAVTDAPPKPARVTESTIDATNETSKAAAADATAAQAPVAEKRRVDPRVAELLAQAREEHDNGQYDDEIRDYDQVLQLDRNNSEARRGRARAVRAKNADPGSQL